MANLKNITELPVAESAEGLNLIVNDNGSAKQIAASAVGAQADWTETDENNPAYIKNKPDVSSGNVQYVEQELTDAQKIQARKNLGLYYSTEENIEEFELTFVDGSANYNLQNLDIIGAGGQIRVALLQDGGERFSFTGTVNYQGNPVYDYLFTASSDRGQLECFFGDWTYNGPYSISGTYQVIIYHVNTVQISEEFIPNTIARTSDIPNFSPATAVADAAGETVTSTEFNALLTALRDAGYLET